MQRATSALSNEERATAIRLLKKVGVAAERALDDPAAATEIKKAKRNTDFRSIQANQE